MPSNNPHRKSAEYQRARRRLKREGAHICWLCGLPIDMELTKVNPRHPRAWSADHDPPLNSPLSDPNNPSQLREAHYGCNASRQDRDKTPNKTSRQW